MRVSLASCYQRLGQCELALDHARSAARDEPGGGETQWLCELLERQCAVEERGRELRAEVLGARGCTPDSLQMPEPTQVRLTQSLTDCSVVLAWLHRSLIQ